MTIICILQASIQLLMVPDTIAVPINTLRRVQDVMVDDLLPNTCDMRVADNWSEKSGLIAIIVSRVSAATAADLRGVVMPTGSSVLRRTIVYVDANGNGIASTMFYTG